MDSREVARSKRCDGSARFDENSEGDGLGLGLVVAGRLGMGRWVDEELKEEIKKNKGREKRRAEKEIEKR